jgi:hypothetical protein
MGIERRAELRLAGLRASAAEATVEPVELRTPEAAAADLQVAVAFFAVLQSSELAPAKPLAVQVLWSMAPLLTAKREGEAGLKWAAAMPAVPLCCDL